MNIIEISPEEYEQLLADQNLLECLRSAGVYNWEGYQMAMDMFEEGDYE